MNMIFRIPGLRFLTVLNLFGIGMVVMRALITGSFSYFFLYWNLFLAAVPLGLSLIISLPELAKSKVLIWILTALWILFLPNAPYLVTDLLHLSYSHHRYIWFDTLMIFTFAISGLAFGLISVKLLSEVVSSRMGLLVSRFFTSMALFASGFGVYLGRYQRFNSWDIVHNPGNLIADIFNRISHPLDHPRTWGMTLLVGIFLHILYYGWQEMNHQGNTPIRTPGIS